RASFLPRSAGSCSTRSCAACCAAARPNRPGAPAPARSRRSFGPVVAADPRREPLPRAARRASDAAWPGAIPSSCAALQCAVSAATARPRREGARARRASRARSEAASSLFTLVLHVDRSPDGFGVPFEFGGCFADLCVVVERTLFVRNDRDRQRHDRIAVQRSPAIARLDVALAEIVGRIQLADVAIEAVDDLARDLF